MTEPEQRQLERKTVFVLTGILLAAIVSISFYNLDRHPAFIPPSDELIDAVNDTSAPVVFAQDPVALSVLEDRQADIDPAVYPLTSWPAQGPMLAFGSRNTARDASELELLTTESVWSLWSPEEIKALPFFGLATVEVEGPDGEVRSCQRAAKGGHQCGDAGWNRIRQRELTIDGETETCIWAHPIGDHRLRYRFPEITSVGPDGQRLRLESALTDRSVGGGGAVDFEIHHGNATTSHRHRDRRGWQHTILEAVDEPRELIVEVSASEVGRRHICFRFDLP